MKRCTDSYREPLQQVISGILVNRLVLKFPLADAPRVNRYALLLAFLLGLRGLSSGLHRAIRSGIKISLTQMKYVVYYTATILWQGGL